MGCVGLPHRRSQGSLIRCGFPNTSVEEKNDKRGETYCRSCKYRPTSESRQFGCVEEGTSKKQASAVMSPSRRSLGSLIRNGFKTPRGREKIKERSGELTTLRVAQDVCQRVPARDGWERGEARKIADDSTRPVSSRTEPDESATRQRPPSPRSRLLELLSLGHTLIHRLNINHNGRLYFAGPEPRRRRHTHR